jgi:signal transduction histidine kinase
MSVVETQTRPARESGAYDTREPERSLQRVGLLLAAVARETKVSGVLSAIVNGLVETMGAASACVYLIDGQGRSLGLSAHCGVDAKWRAQMGRLTLDDPAPAARAATTGMPVVVTDDDAALHQPPPPDDPARANRRAIYAAPLMADDKRVGAVTCEFTHDLAPGDAMMLGDAAEVLGPLLERAMLLDSHGALQEHQLLRQEWLAVVGHELRHPLHMLSMNALFLARRVGHDPPETRIQNIFHAVRQLDRMITDLRDASAVEMRRVPLKTAPVDVAKLASDIVHREYFPYARVVTVEAEIGLPAIAVDAFRIEAVLVNLLVNADRYARAGTPIVVSMVRDEAEVLVSVTNEGEPIAPEEREAIFDRFRRAGSAGCDADRLGLGLYISRGLVEAHGGRMWVDSEPERGNAFRFTLPMTPSKYV